LVDHRALLVFLIIIIAQGIRMSITLMPFLLLIEIHAGDAGGSVQVEDIPILQHSVGIVEEPLDCGIDPTNICSILGAIVLAQATAHAAPLAIVVFVNGLFAEVHKLTHSHIAYTDIVVVHFHLLV
jgi:hypothetical protein